MTAIPWTWLSDVKAASCAVERRGKQVWHALRRALLAAVLLTVTPCLFLQNKAAAQSPAGGLELEDPGAGLEASEASEGVSASPAELVRQRRWREAAAAARQALAEDPGGAQAHYLLGVALWGLEDKVGSIQALRSAEKLGLDAAYLHKTLGLAYYAVNQFRLFEQQMERAAELAPDDPAPYFRLGRYFESVHDDFERAVELYDQALARDPDHLRSHYFKGRSLALLRRTQEAERSYRSAIKLVRQQDERFSAPYRALAGLLQNDEPRRALELARQAVELEPELAENRFVLGAVHEAAGRLEKAAEAFRAALELDPEDGKTHFRLFRLYQRLDRPQQAQAHRERFEALKAVYGNQ